MTDARIGVDVGGTFTDVALVVDDDLVTAKVPTTGDQSVGVFDGIRKACDEAGIEPESVDHFAHAMTVSVNALLERAGAETALVTTAGFRDVLEIGRQARPDLYDLDVDKPTPLVPRRRRFELDERATPEGIDVPVDEDEVRDVAAAIESTGAESVAVSLLHAYAHPENERVVTETLREELDVPVSASHEVLSEFREFERTATTVADAYVAPGIGGYLGRLLDRSREEGLPEPRIMKSNGGVADIETVRSQAVTTVLSGPAAGVVGAATTAGSERAGVVTFDMGGTSSDVSLVRDGDAERSSDTEIGGVPIRTPMVDIETVGAGGGSIAWVDAGGALRVGPESAGADPGPACYGHGGERPTVTDANVVLGYIGSEAALGGELTIDADAAHAALERLADEAGLEDAEDAARGVYRVANATMTRAIRSVTVERGHDPRSFGLVAFGGAGPMHATALADRLDIERVVIPGPAGVLSAYGLLAADETHDTLRTVRLPLGASDPSEGIAVYGDLESAVIEAVSDPDEARLERAADCRYAGQSFELTVPVETFDPERVAERFETAHERAYGYRLDAPVEAVTLRVTAAIGTEPPSVSRAGGGDGVIDTREAVFPDVGTVETTVYGRGAMEPGTEIAGPAILERAESTTVVQPGWRGRIRSDGALSLERVADDAADTEADT
ncbi:MAG: hydantoinase/oxoprolinase family protein [Natronomonas sp.]|uniref:hydantoinase/oxoprolinase family protein n=1 Tax=Natronomonas sp. TaxID=2184060 RepID=UPI0028707725|nr:hydantoinase/oxoprolinase family protein [Natronomonas sp.]MDR9430027.1 hydantoinase/oxoprolinase family protein [Natronomonas sp.]